WHLCGGVNKYGDGSLTSGTSTTPPTTVTLRNTGTVPAHLSLLPSACSDTISGAGGLLCSEVSVTLSCSAHPPFALGPVSLNAFHAARNYPTGISVGTVTAGSFVSCSFTLTAGTITTVGTLSQPIAWRLQA